MTCSSQCQIFELVACWRVLLAAFTRNLRLESSFLRRHITELSFYLQTFFIAGTPSKDVASYSCPRASKFSFKVK